jgi:beta-galactosidase/beta-glucuronidase
MALHHLGPSSSGRSVRQSHSLRLTGATPVSIEHASDGTWQYIVDGTTETIRGVGYNPQYAGLSPLERAATYDRDFADMHRLGVNTIEGWFEPQFDSVTLDSAARNGIGVMMPFELNQDWDYTNANVTASILDHVSAYVEKYKDHPAVRMWSPGNENLHRILYAHWVSQVNDPNARARAQAFAAFLPVLVDRIHELDPNHPVVYRDAEDVYLSWITGPFSQDGVDRPWLVYGANVYSTTRLQQIVANWPNQWPGRPLLISEFAPGGVGPTERPLGFQQQWNVIRSRPDDVLGGLAYAWATNGPEDLDRVFGLVDPNGVPTDGALAALSAVYQSDGTATADTPAAN